MEQAADIRGKGTNPLSCTMIPLDYSMEVTFECGPRDANVATFTEAASIIGGHNAVEEFLACGMWPLSKKFGFKVETKETPLSKVVVSMPQVTHIIGVQEQGTAFEARIMNAASLLVGNYNITEHNAYKGLRHGWLNWVFELVGVLYRPRQESIVHKRKIGVLLPAPALVPPPQKFDQKRRRTKGLSRSEDQTSTQELALAKALKPSKKFSLGSSGLSLTEKASASKGGVHGGKTSLPNANVGGTVMTPKALDLFGFASSTSEGEAAAPAHVPHWKRPHKSSPKTIQKSSDVPIAKGTSVRKRSIRLFYVCYI
jgi:hypothetical protein